MRNYSSSHTSTLAHHHIKNVNCCRRVGSVRQQGGCEKIAVEKGRPTTSTGKYR